MYLAQATRYDILYAVNQLARAMPKPAKAHMGAAEHLLGYLAGSADFSIITYKQGGFRLAVFSDANWGNSPDNSRSRPSYIVTLANAPIIFKVGLQGLSVQSTTEVELVAGALTMKEAGFCSNMMLELGFDENFDSVPLYIDNTLALHVAGNRTYSPRAKLISLRYYFFVQKLVCRRAKSASTTPGARISRQTWSMSTLASTATATSSSSSTRLRLKTPTHSSTPRRRPLSFCARNTCVLLTIFSALCNYLQRCTYTALFFCSRYYCH